MFIIVTRSARIAEDFKDKTLNDYLSMVECFNRLRIKARISLYDEVGQECVCLMETVLYGDEDGE